MSGPVPILESAKVSESRIYRERTAGTLYTNIYMKIVKWSKKYELYHTYRFFVMMVVSICLWYV